VAKKKGKWKRRLSKAWRILKPALQVAAIAAPGPYGVIAVGVLNSAAKVRKAKRDNLSKQQIAVEAINHIREQLKALEVEEALLKERYAELTAEDAV
jgi:hypothetical protein